MKVMTKYPSGSKPASISHLSKIHKLNTKKDILKSLSLRPIISSIGSYNYNPVIATANSTKDSFTFCEEIKKVTATNQFLTSYDACSLTTDIAVDSLFEHNPEFKRTKN